MVCDNGVMVIRKINTKKILVGILVFALTAVPVVTNLMMVKSAATVSLACKNSPECMAAVAKEQEANRNAAAASSSANMFQMKVHEMNMEIAGQELAIAETEAQVNSLTKQIAETEEKLTAEQEALAELLINMHFEGDAEPITILAGASSISDLAEKQARAETVKQQISATAEKVKVAKEQLEADKAEVESLLAQQKTAKEQLVAKRAEQQALVEKYQNDAAAYDAVAKAAREAAREAEQEEQRKHPELYGGNQYAGAVNSYMWQDYCPGQQDAFLTSAGGYIIGGYVCECVSYAGWKAYETFGIAISWGHAYSWDDNARRNGYVVDRTPAVDTIGQDDGYPYGHVFWVESVNADGSINVTEYNNAYATQLYSGVFQYGDFGARTIPAYKVGNYNYIHLR